MAVVLAFAAPTAAWADECPAGGSHDYEAELVAQATDDADGLRRYTCTKCGASYDEAIPATGHAWGPWITDVEPTCTSEGHAYRECTRHEGYAHREETVLPALSATGEHTWAEVSRQEPTCEQQGVAHLRCTVCGAEKDESLPALGHEWGAWETADEPTEGAEGLERRVCAHDPAHVEERALPKLPAAEGRVEPTVAQVEPAGDEPEAPAAEEANPWQPNALDGALLVVDAVAVVAFAAAAAPLLYTRRWVAAKKRSAQEHARHFTDNEKGGRVL